MSHASSHSCGSCGKPKAASVCSRCQSIYYCNSVCQRAHWKREHRSACLPAPVASATSAKALLAQVPAVESVHLLTSQASRNEALVAAVSTGSLGPVEALLAAGADACAPHPRIGSAALHAAVMHKASMELLLASLQCGAASGGIETADNAGHTALWCAVAADAHVDQEEVVLLLLRAGAKVEGAMHALCGDTEKSAAVLEILVKAGAHVDSVDASGLRAVDRFAFHGATANFRAACAAGASIEPVPVPTPACSSFAAEGWPTTTLLHLAAESNAAGILEAYAALPLARPWATVRNGCNNVSPLHVAALSNSVDAADVLLATVKHIDARCQVQLRMPVASVFAVSLHRQPHIAVNA